MPRSQEFPELTGFPVDTVRATALGADAGAPRAIVLPAAAASAVLTALEDDGLPTARGTDAAAMIRACGLGRRRGSPIALARAVRDALVTSGSRVLLLDRADSADEATVRFWWSLAVLLAEEGAPDGLLLAGIAGVAGAWSRVATSVRGLVPVRELAPPAPPPPAVPAAIPARRGPRTAARRALLRTAAALLRGSPEQIEGWSLRGEELALASGDPGDAAAAMLARALQGFPADREEPLVRALALARIADDAGLAAACETALGAASWLRGDLADGRRRLAAATPADLPRSLRTALADLGVPARFHDTASKSGRTPRAPRRNPAFRSTSGQVWNGGSANEPARRTADEASAAANRHARAGRLAVAARLFAMTAAQLGEPFTGLAWSRARAVWDESDPRLAAALAAAGAPGLGGAALPPGVAGIAEALRATAAFVGTGEASPGAALELACQMVPARTASLATADGTILAIRGAAALAPGVAFAALPQSLAAGAAVRIVLGRAADDPAFSRDERRLASAIAEVAAAVLSHTPAPPPPAASRVEAPARATRAVTALDHRLSSVERQALVEAMKRNGGNLSRTARALGLSRNGLKMKLARHGLPRG